MNLVHDFYNLLFTSSQMYFMEYKAYPGMNKMCLSDFIV